MHDGKGPRGNGVIVLEWGDVVHGSPGQVFDLKANSNLGHKHLLSAGTKEY